MKPTLKVSKMQQRKTKMKESLMNRKIVGRYSLSFNGWEYGYWKNSRFYVVATLKG
jgi:hypothetical protein